MMGAITFQRRRERGGIVRIALDGRFAGEIVTCKWGYALRLIGVYWHGADQKPALGGISQRGFRRQKDAIVYVREELPLDWLKRSADKARELRVVMA